MVLKEVIDQLGDGRVFVLSRDDENCCVRGS